MTMWPCRSCIGKTKKKKKRGKKHHFHFHYYYLPFFLLFISHFFCAVCLLFPFFSLFFFFFLRAYNIRCTHTKAMSSVENIPVSIPEMETLCEKKEAAVTTLLQKVLSQYGNVYPPQFMKCANEEDRRILAYKYLKARSWKVSDSMEMIKENMTFRAKHDADHMNLFPCVFPLRGFDEEDLCRTIQDPYTEKQRWTELCYLATAPYYSAGYH
ncbi:hypothetical protein, conserved, partial [Trypanosoma cruzi]